MTFDLRRILDCQEETIEQLAANPDQKHVITLDGKSHTIEGKWLLINLPLWLPAIRRNEPISSEYLFHNEFYVPAVQVRVFSAQYRDFVEAGKYCQYTVLIDIAEGINLLYHIVAEYLGAHMRSIDAFSLAETREHLEFSSAYHVDFSSPDIRVIEHRISEAAKRLDKKLSDPKLKDINTLYPYIRLRSLSPQQVTQVMVAAGTRTDVSDRMINSAIQRSYADGLGNIRDAAIDSMTAQKSAIYTKDGLPKTRYEDRKLQLLCASMEHLYTEDCGTSLTVPYRLTEQRIGKCVGKLYVENGELKEIPSHGYDHLIDKVVNLRSPLVCNHVDGTCHVCAGRMTNYLMPNTLVGVASAVELMGPTAQLILSNKHYSVTSSLPYVIASPMSELMIASRGEIRFKDNTKLDQLALAIPIEDAYRIGDVRFVDDKNVINDQHFSSIHTMEIINSETGEIVIPLTQMSDKNKTTPYLSKAILQHVIDNPDSLIQTDHTVIIKLKGFNADQAIMGYVIENASMIRFATKIYNFLSQGVRKYTSTTEVLRDLTDNVYQKLDTNIMYLEIILRAFMITSPQDMRIPIVTDPERVLFGNRDVIIAERSIAAQSVYQGHVRWLKMPRTFTVPKPAGPFDPLLGMHRTVRR